MSNNKTPLQLVAEIQSASYDLFEVRLISNALKKLAESADHETLKTTARALGVQLGYLAGRNTDIYWTANDLQKALTAQVLADTEDADESKPITDGEEVTENDLPFK